MVESANILISANPGISKFLVLARQAIPNVLHEDGAARLTNSRDLRMRRLSMENNRPLASDGNWLGR